MTNTNDKAMSQELKNCPRCEYSAPPQHIEKERKHFDSNRLECTRCGYSTATWPSREVAAFEWNRAASHAQQLQSIAGLPSDEEIDEMYPERNSSGTYIDSALSVRAQVKSMRDRIAPLLAAKDARIKELETQIHILDTSARAAANARTGETTLRALERIEAKHNTDLLFARAEGERDGLLKNANEMKELRAEVMELRDQIVQQPAAPLSWPGMNERAAFLENRFAAMPDDVLKKSMQEVAGNGWDAALSHVPPVMGLCREALEHIKAVEDEECECVVGNPCNYCHAYKLVDQALEALRSGGVEVREGIDPEYNRLLLDEFCRFVDNREMGELAPYHELSEQAKQFLEYIKLANKKQ